MWFSKFCLSIASTPQFPPKNECQKLNWSRNITHTSTNTGHTYILNKNINQIGLLGPDWCAEFVCNIIYQEIIIATQF